MNNMNDMNDMNNMNDNENDADILLDKTKIITTDQLFNKIKEFQIQQLIKGGLGYLLATFAIRILDNLIFIHFNDNKILETFLLIIVLFTIVYLAISTFTYVQIEQDKDILLKDDLS